MALFDGYRLSNSTEIPRFQGSAGDELIKVGQYRQNMYDQAFSGGMGTAQSANELNTNLGQDQWAVDELRNSTQAKIKELAQKGDWENALPEVTQLARNYAYREKEILAPQQAAQEYRKSLGDKEKNLTPEQQQALYAMSIKGYQGLKKNDRGQYIGAFNGITPAKNIDVNKWVDERLKDAVSQKYGNEAIGLSADDGGMWIMKNGVKVDKLPAEIKDNKGNLIGGIRYILKSARENDAEFQAYQNMQGRIAGFNAANSGITNINQLPPSIQSSIKSDMDKGHPFSEAYANAVYNATIEGIANGADAYGVSKFQKDNVEYTHDMKDNPYELKKAPNESTVVSPLISQGPDSKLTADEKNYDKITKNLNDTKANNTGLQESINRLEKDLKSQTLSPATRTQKQVELNGLKNQLDEAQVQANRSQQIIDYSKDQTARGLGYDDYNDFVEKHKQPFTGEIQKVFPNGFTTSTGRKISVDELAKAAVDNRIQPISGGGTAGVIQGVNLTLKDGSTIKIPPTQKGNALWNSISEAYQNKGRAVNDFNDKLKTTHEKNVENFAIQTNNISMTEPIRNEVEAHIKSNIDGVKFFDPGQNNTVKPPSNFKVYTVGTLGLGNSTKIRVQELDENNKPTDKFYDVTLNSNLSDIVSNQAAESQDPTARLAADMLTAGSGARQLTTMIPGQEINVGQLGNQHSPDADPINVKLTVNRDRQGKPVYNLINAESGDIITTADGKPYSTDNVGTAGSWIDNIQGKATFSNGKRQSIYNAKSRRVR